MDNIDKLIKQHILSFIYHIFVICVRCFFLMSGMMNFNNYYGIKVYYFKYAFRLYAGQLFIILNGNVINVMRNIEL